MRANLFSALSLGAFFVAGSPAMADALTDMCKSVLSRPSNSFTSAAQREWAKAQAHSMCELGINSSSAFHKAATSLGLSVPLAAGLLGFNAGDSVSDAQAQEAYHRVCESGNFSDVGKSQEFLQNESINDRMLASHDFCVGQLKEIYTAISPRGIVIEVPALRIVNSFTD